MWKGRGHRHSGCQLGKACPEFYSHLRADDCWPLRSHWINIHIALQKTRQMAGLVLVWRSILQRRDGFPARAKVAEEQGLFNARGCDSCGCVATNFLGNVGFTLGEERWARLLFSLSLKVVKCVFGVFFLLWLTLVTVNSHVQNIQRASKGVMDSLCSSYACWIYFSKRTIVLFYLLLSNLDWKVSFTQTRGAGSPALQSEINQSNQKNIMECISAGRCYSLPSSSIDLQSRS